MDNELIRKAKLNATRARSRSTDQQLKLLTEQQQQLASTGYYLSYDAAAGLHILELATGEIVGATSITNSGQAPGDLVVVSWGNGWRFKAMPA